MEVEKGGMVVGAEAYRQAGVDIDAGARALDLMRSAVRSTFGPNVVSDVGHFGGLYAFEGRGQVLVASADSVGTKLMLHAAMGTHRKAGHDIVNHCVNDILACGARPLFFLDYVAADRLVPEQVAEVVGGMAEACRDVGCALIGGETAELPGIYREGQYDVAGFIVGSVARDGMVLGEGIIPGDIVYALPSSGLHTNGYTLARKVFGLEGNPAVVRERLGRYEEALGCTIGEALTEPHRPYLAEMSPLLDMPERPIKGIAHITGGGLVDNIPRVLPEGCAVELDTNTWRLPVIFRLIQAEGGVDSPEMARVFNMGLGMVFVISPEHAQVVESAVPNSMRVGRVVRQSGGQRVILRAE